MNICRPRLDSLGGDEGLTGRGLAFDTAFEAIWATFLVSFALIMIN